MEDNFVKAWVCSVLCDQVPSRQTYVDIVSCSFMVVSRPTWMSCWNPISVRLLDVTLVSCAIDATLCYSPSVSAGVSGKAFITAAPSHSFLAQAIETVVNNVRNRFTLVDVDPTFCPDPEFPVLHALSTLFMVGPCILGSVVNKALGRHGQTEVFLVAPSLSRKTSRIWVLIALCCSKIIW